MFVRLEEGTRRAIAEAATARAEARREAEEAEKVKVFQCENIPEKVKVFQCQNIPEKVEVFQCEKFTFTFQVRSAKAAAEYAAVFWSEKYRKVASIISSTIFTTFPFCRWARRQH